eukprot:2281645-Ditylum_brightwellii.AAC.1
MAEAREEVPDMVGELTKRVKVQAQTSLPVKKNPIIVVLENHIQKWCMEYQPTGVASVQILNQIMAQAG